jgi:hypothetical protein
MAMSSYMRYELHCDRPGCGSRITGSNPEVVFEEAISNRSWRHIVHAGAPNSLDLLYYCNLHEPSHS